MNDRFYIKKVISRIEKKLNWEKVSLWTDHEYRKLSSLIYENTSISISPQTLKRLFGKVKYKNDYTAQPATKEALARFLDYPGWDAFVSDQSAVFSRYSYLLKKRWIGSLSNVTSIFLFLAGILVISTSVVLIKSKRKSITFNAVNIEGMTPHTVSFHYDISSFRNKEVYIDFDQKETEDNTSLELLDKQRTLLNHCYESPGFFNVKVLSEGKVLGAAKIHSLSEGWVSYYFNDDNFSKRKFVFGLENRVRDNENDGLMYISPKDLNNQGFNGNTVYYLEHMIFQDFLISADSCTFEVSYRNSSDIGGISCYDTEFRIIGENGIASVMLVQNGCYRWSEITIGEKHLNGKYNDLSFLSTDLSRWNVLRIKTENNFASIINGTDTLFTSQYNQQLGRIKGIRLITKGSGVFDYLSLFDREGQLVYDDRFGIDQPD
jgi:hypothetical protein